MKKLFIAALLMSAATIANAQDHVGGGVMYFDDEDISLTSIAATYDYKPTDNFALELGLAMGGDDEVTVPPVGRIEVELDYAVFAKGKLGVTAGNAFWYGMAGYSTFNLEASALGATLSDDGNGSLLGVGVDFAVSDTWGVGLEYSRGFNDLEDTNIFQAVLQYRF